MAIVRRLKPFTLDKDTPHSECECTYSVVRDKAGTEYLQIDTYGSKDRQIPGKKSQSIRLAPEAIAQLKEIISTHFR